MDTSFARIFVLFALTLFVKGWPLEFANDTTEQVTQPLLGVTAPLLSYVLIPRNPPETLHCGVSSWVRNDGGGTNMEDNAD
jgi:hypothetical protein